MGPAEMPMSTVPETLPARHLVLVAGARPNFMKIAPVIHELRSRPELFRWSLVHTGQHYDEKMSGVFFAQLGLPEPDAHLGAGGGSHGQQTARILEAFEQHLMQLPEPPAGVMVAGDVNSTIACALAAVKMHIPVAHLEAGLRSGDRGMPEEINRLATDAISDLLLVSEPAGEENLRAEGVPDKRLRYVGNVMIDTLVRQLPAASKERTAEAFRLPTKGYGLVTLHRPSNVDDLGRLQVLVETLRRVSERLPLVFPVHPRTRQKLAEAANCALGPDIHVTEPLPYLQLLSLQKDAAVVITDSGGIQEETSYLGVPCLTLRPSTERPVTIRLGTNTLVPGDPSSIEDHVNDILQGKGKQGGPIPGWDGRAASRVVDALDECWS
jgi:UDP-N-acetylglucosamine 2-epimerase (non-hydrolysing)